VVAPVSRRTFGSFVEHLGRCVYGGIVDPDHPQSDEHGFRQDVLELVREMGVSVVRYPGGNFVSGYKWEDGVGPVEERPVRLDAAWKSIETNKVGLHEFSRWAAQAGVETMLAVNLGTRGMQEALELLEYANHPGGTALSDLRRAHGTEEPFGITLWCLGNEMDGPWQTGHKTPVEYGRLASETASAMRQLDPTLELVACGSSHSSMPTFGEWESTVLDLAMDKVDYVSAHAYYELKDGDLPSFLASAVDMDHMVEAVVATADAVAARRRTPKRIMISFDEWNVWYQQNLDQCVPTEWTEAPRVSEEAYTVADAVVVGNLLISLLRHSDRVTAACQAQLVNAIAPIRRSRPAGVAADDLPPLRADLAPRRGQRAARRITAPTTDTAAFGSVPVLDAVATHDPGHGEVTVFVTNRTCPRTPTSRCRCGPSATTSTSSRRGPSPTPTRSPSTRRRRRTGSSRSPRRRRSSRDGVLHAQLPPVSWSALRLGRSS
jgi:alpha-N-arabinofuranosidase